MTISYVRSDRFETTNNAYSLWLAREHLDEDVFLVEGDVVFEAEVLRRLVSDADSAAVMAISRWRPGMDGTVVSIDRNGRVVDVVLAAEQDRVTDLSRMYKTVNLHLLRAFYLREKFLPDLEELITSGKTGEYYEKILARTVADGNFAVGSADCGDLRWCEVDDMSDLAAAEYSFGNVDERLDLLGRLHGGYWRYDVIDHCLLTNAYFPTPPLLDALRAELRNALIHYPVGHAALQELLAAVLRLPADRLVVTNGASESIKVLGRIFDKVALVVPGFNEYEAVFNPAQISNIELSSPGFELDIEECYQVATRHGVQAVIITSPNNPTSIAVPREELLLLCKLLAGSGTRLVVDESFVDFCANEQSLESELVANPNLVIVKSMSKAFGVGGLRLGYLAAGDPKLASRVRSAVPIWNINGLAESFLRLLPRFRADFQESLRKVRADRDELYRLLSEIPGMHVYKPDANFVLARLPEPWTGARVTRILLDQHGMYVKDCSGKSMPQAHRYVRISSRTSEENRRLVAAMKALLSGEASAHSTQIPTH